MLFMSNVFVPVCNIALGKINVNSCNEVIIVESLDELTTTCTLKLAKAIVVKSKDYQNQPIENYITPGMPVKIQLGYNGELNMEFNGYVARGVRTSMPLEIQCEDEMYMLKRSKVTAKAWQNANLTDIIAHIAPGYKTDVLDIQLGKFIIGMPSAPTACEVLEALRQEFGIQSYFRYENDIPVLVSGKPNLYTLEHVKNTYGLTVLYHMQRNVADFGSLEYVSSSDRKIRMDYKSRLSNGKVLSSTFTGDADGETHSITFVGLTQAQIDAWAKEDYAKAKIDGYKGSITGFGLPVCRAGQSCMIVDKVYEDRKSTHLVNKVEVNFSNNGFRRIATIGRRLI